MKTQFAAVLLVLAGVSAHAVPTGETETPVVKRQGPGDKDIWFWTDSNWQGTNYIVGDVETNDCESLGTDPIDLPQTGAGSIHSVQLGSDLSLAIYGNSDCSGSPQERYDNGYGGNVQLFGSWRACTQKYGDCDRY